MLEYLGYRTWLMVLSVLVAACGREQPQPLDPLATELAERMIARKATRPGLDYDLPYRLFVPQGYDRQRLYPLIIYLHPTGANGVENVRQLGPPVAQMIGPVQETERSFVMAPQCPEWDKWVSKAKGPPFLNYSQLERPASAAVQLVVVALDDLIAEYSIDSDRIYVTGASSGGTGTWDIVTRSGIGRFAAAVPITGTNDPSRAPVIADLPIWAFHGSADSISPVRNTREMVGALVARGSHIRYTEYQGVEHYSWGQAYAEPELFMWMFSQRRSHH